jgi:hypothetical protein
MVPSDWQWPLIELPLLLKSKYHFFDKVDGVKVVAERRGGQGRQFLNINSIIWPIDQPTIWLFDFHLDPVPPSNLCIYRLSTDRG